MEVNKKINNTFLLIILTTILSCNSQLQCLDSYNEFNGFSYSPNLSIIDKVYTEKGCKYKTGYILCINGVTHLGEGIVYLKNNAFYLSLDTDSSFQTVIFDLNAKIRDEYEVDFYYPDFKENLTYKIILLEKLQLEKHCVYMYKIYNSFCENDYMFDQVFFITKKNGVIGSYISKIDNNQTEWIYSPRGNLLKNKLDYTKKKFGKIL